MKTALLRELCQIKHGGTPSKGNSDFWRGTIPWVSPKDMKSSVLEDATDHISEEAVASSATTVVPEGSTLVVVRSGILVHSVPIAQTKRPLAFNQDIKALIPISSAIDRDYLFWFMRGSEQFLLARGVKKGATVHSLQSGAVENLVVPLPPLDEQRRIVDLLSRAEGIVRLRREAQRKAAEIIPALFLDMFGDPATNPKAWPVVTVGDLIHSAQDGPHVSPIYADSGIPFLSTRHVKPGQILFEDLKFLTREEAAKQWKKCKPQRGDVLYTKGGTTGLAAAIDFDTEIAVWVHVAVLKTDHSKVHPLWLESMLNTDFCYRQSQELTHGIANRDLGLKRMVRISAYLPPKAEQQRFVEFALRIRAVREQQASAVGKAEATFKALLARVFLDGEQIRGAGKLEAVVA